MSFYEIKWRGPAVCVGQPASRPAVGHAYADVVLAQPAADQPQQEVPGDSDELRSTATLVRARAAAVTSTRQTGKHSQTHTIANHLISSIHILFRSRCSGSSKEFLHRDERKAIAVANTLENLKTARKVIVLAT